MLCHSWPTLILYYHLYKKVLELTINTKYKSGFKDLLLAETRSVAHQHRDASLSLRLGSKSSLLIWQITIQSMIRILVLISMAGISLYLHQQSHQSQSLSPGICSLLQANYYLTQCTLVRADLLQS